MYIKLYISECALSYGENCQYPCSVHCINKVCDRFNGTCLFGCAKGESCDRGLCISFSFFIFIFIYIFCQWAFVLFVSSMHKSLKLDFWCRNTTKWWNDRCSRPYMVDYCICTVVRHQHNIYHPYHDKVDKTMVNVFLFLN